MAQRTREMPGDTLRAGHWFLASLLLALVAALAFQPALRNVLTHDDIAQVTGWSVPESPGGWIAALAQPWWPPARLKHDWRPVARLTVLAQQALSAQSGNNALWPFYAFNIALYGAVCLLLLAAAMRLGMPPRAALVGTLLFAAHPIHAEAVHQIVGRTELLAAGWMLAGLILWTRWGPFSAHAFWQQPLVYALALGSKEHAMLYPFYLALTVLAAPVGCLPGDRGWGRWRLTQQACRLLALLATLAGVLGLYVLGRAAATGGLLVPLAAVPYAENPLAHMAFVNRLPAVLGALGFAVTCLLWPVGLAPDYTAASLPYDLGWRWTQAWFGLASLTAITLYGAVSAARGGRGWALAAGGVIGWLLTSNLVFTIGAAVAPRLWFWPSAAACLGFGWLLMLLLERLPGDVRERIRALATATVVLLLLAICWHDARQWRSPRDYAGSTLTAFPDNWRARVNLARLDYLARDFVAGLAHAERATRVFPDEAIGWGWVGLNAMPLTGHERQAEEAFRRALALDPNQPETYQNLANLLRMLGRADEAEAVLRQFPHVSADGAGVAMPVGVNPMDNSEATLTTGTLAGRIE